MLFPMNIRLDKGIERRFAYTDRKGGWLELTSGSAATTSGGYFRGNRRLLADFFVSTDVAGSDSFSETADLYRTNAHHTDVRPDGFSAVFAAGKNEIALDVSLLIDERSFYLTLRNTATKPALSASLSGLGLLFDVSGAVPAFWHRAEQNGLTVWYTDSGIALASLSPFHLDAASYGRVVISSDDPSAVWYLTFESDAGASRNKAVRLAQTGAVTDHRAKIANFFEGFRSDSGDADFDEAVRWAQFSGWMLGNDEYGPGLWAGLPWFREQWGRDTFIALTGILLVSGRFGEARSMLVAFASLQNRDPASPDCGCLPNRYRGADDVIYNSADGTLWFIRALWEYVDYTGDVSILSELRATVDLALECDELLRVDESGFLRHGDADTWMDARVRGGEAWAARGDRACEIQALRYTALRIGERMARLLADEGGAESDDDGSALRALADRRRVQADALRESFCRLFWCGERNALADRLPPGKHGEWLRDFRVRPNQLLAATVPSVLGGDDSLLDPAQREAVLENVRRELVSPFGLFSLCPDDPLFHPDHINPEWHQKDAAYHNGTISLWTTGAFVSASALSPQAASGSALGETASALIRNEALLLGKAGCAGTLGGTIHAKPDQAGQPVLSGTWSQAVSVSEFSRNVYQDLIGFRPRLSENRIGLSPRLPSGIERWSAEVSFGPGWKLSIEQERVHDIHGSYLRCRLLWKTGEARARALTVNGTPIRPDTMIELRFPSDGPVSRNHRPDTYRVDTFPHRDLAPEWCGAARQRNYLERLIAGGRMKGGGDNTAALEWFFDSDYFRKKYDTRLPLGALWSPGETVFRLWAPTARSVSLMLYLDGSDTLPPEGLPMKAGTLQNGRSGVWELTVPGDLHGVYYRVRVQEHGIIRDSADPYAFSCGINGRRSMVVDPERVKPRPAALSEGAVGDWDNLNAPVLPSPNDAVIYEAHIADISSSPSWNGDSALRRSYLAACRSGTSRRGAPTGFDHIVSLGVTHIQLQPVFDFGCVDESRLRDPLYAAQARSGLFNWGYDPENYTAPEGSYSTDPAEGAVRIRELKAFIGECLRRGIGVIMDVVYNHVPSAQDHPLGICVAGYYFRVDSYSGAGDDTASEREMFRAYMIGSLCHWLAEYKLSGFRFDLMGLHDVETIRAISDALRKIKSDVLLYGEGWDMYRGGKMVGASMMEARKLSDIGFFNDAIRCAIKGPVFTGHEGGFIHDGSHRESLKFGLVGAVYHPQVHNQYVDGTANPNPWSDRTGTSVNYTEIHDNATLYDKLQLVEADKGEDYYERLQRMAIGLVLLAQGQPVLHAGMEFMRTKEIPADILADNPDLPDLYWNAAHTRAFSHNSYNLCDRINGLDWERCADKQALVNWVRSLIAVRRAHPLFRLRTAAEVAASLSFIDSSPSTPALLAWKIDGTGIADLWRSVCVIVNPSPEAAGFALPACAEGCAWRLITDGSRFFDGDGHSGSERGPLPLPAGTTAVIDGKALYLYAEF